MILRISRLWIILIVIPGILTILVGCAQTNPPETSFTIEPRDTQTLPFPTSTKPTVQPSPMDTMPGITPSAEEIPSDIVPTPMPESVSLMNPGFEDQETGRNAGWLEELPGQQKPLLSKIGVIRAISA